MSEFIGQALNYLPLVVFEAYCVYAAARYRLPVSSVVIGQMYFVVGAAPIFLIFRDAPLVPFFTLVGAVIGAGVLFSRVRPPTAPARPLSELEPALLADLEVRRERLAEAVRTGGPMPWMPLRVSASIEVAVPPEVAFQFLGMPELWEEWSSGRSTTEWTPGAAWGVGSTFRTDAFLGPEIVSVLGQVTAFDPPHVVGTIGVSKASPSRGERRTERLGTEGTKVSASLAVGTWSRFHALWFLLHWPIYGWFGRREFQRQLRLLKSAAEAHYKRTLEASSSG